MKKYKVTFYMVDGTSASAAVVGKSATSYIDLGLTPDLRSAFVHVSGDDDRAIIINRDHIVRITIEPIGEGA